METTTPEELLARGYKEDPDGRRRFERPFTLPSLALVVGFFVSIVGVLLDKIPFLVGFWSALGFFAVLFAGLMLIYRSTPRSRFTGKPLKKFKNATPAQFVITELIYVCEDTKTFFRRVWFEVGDGAP